MERSEQVDAIFTALAKAQGEIRSALMDSTADVKTREGPGYKFKYADLASVDSACRPALSKNGIAIVQAAENAPDGKGITVRTMLGHTTGQWIAASLTMVPTMTTPQAIGSAITYARRYGLAAICGVVQEDDDGAEASKPAPGDAARSRSVPKQPPTPAPAGPSKDDLLVMVSDWLEVAREDAIGEIKKLASHIGLKTPLQNGDVSKVVELVTALKAKGVNRETLADAIKKD
jgi:hypothetical protein